MTPPLETVEQIFYDALECAPDKRDAFLDKECGGDEVLRRKVEALLAAHRKAGSFIETAVGAVAASIVENGQTDLVIGQTIGHYKILERIGSGGMGEVYLASDITAGRKAALKVLPMRFTGDAERLKRFQQEAHALVGLNHPNILTVYEIGEADSIHYIVSELIEGETLRQRLTRGNVQVGEAVEIAIQVTGALAAAHRAGIVHRDIKPENIMLRPDGYVKVLDFGIAKLAEQELPVTMPPDEAISLVETNLGSILGTVRYMSPEQGRGAPVDKRTDIWSLGAVLYEMAAGHAPFTGDTPRDVMSAILTKEPPPLSSYMQQPPGELQQVVSKALLKDPGQRYQNATEMLEALKGLRHKLEFAAELERYAAPRAWARWIRSPIAVVLTVLAVALAVVFPLYLLRKPTTSPTLENSIAVLPFENLSTEKENAYFADGVQDEILTDLAKIAELKVISRASVMQYKSGVKRNLRQIAQELGVANIVEGSVQRADNRVRVSAQLLDARNDVHLWAEHYDRPLGDVFEIQSEIAKAIADQLRAKLSPREQAAIEKPPTADLAAFDLYTRAKTLMLELVFIAQTKNNLLQAIELLNQAVARDPNFLLAYCRLAYAHDFLYLSGLDRTPAHCAAANSAVQAALRLQPDSGEAHLALAEHLYSCHLDYDHAREELSVAQRLLPNTSEVLELTGLMDRRQGRWEDSARNLGKALQFDPRNLYFFHQMSLTLQCLRLYEQMAAVLDRALEVRPGDVGTRIARARVDLDWHADTKPLHTTIDTILAEDPSAAPSIATSWLILALCERDLAAADRALVALGGNSFGLSPTIRLNREFVEGLIAQMRGDAAAARAAFTAARAKQEEIVRAQPDYASALCVLGLIDAGLGRKEDALREGRRAVELLPVERDAFAGSDVIELFAVICAWTGEKDLACEQLATATQFHSFLSTYGRLRLLPFWDPLRGDPRFEKIVASLAPTQTPSAAPEKSIAVLPFENLSSDKENAFFADGVQDEILTDLSKIADLKVTGHDSVMHYKSGIPRNLREIGQQLGVAHVVEGSVQRVGNRVRVSAQLLDTRTDRHLWGETYDRDLSDVFAIQREIAKTIAQQLHANLSPQGQAAIEKRPTHNLPAYEAYIRGCRYFDDADFDKSIDYFKQAIKVAPSYAAPYGKLATAYYNLAFYNRLAPNLAFERMRNAALQALEKDNTLSEAHGALALVKLHYDLDFPGAENEFKRALELNPNDAAVRHDYAHYLMAIGRTADSAAETGKAMALDPMSTALIGCLCWHHYADRRYDESIAQAQKALKLAPDDPFTHMILGWDYEQKGTSQQAIDELEKAVKLDKASEFTLAALGHAYAIAGKKQELRDILEKFRTKSVEGHVSAFDMAVIYTGLGDKEEAFHWLEKAYEERSSFLVYSRWEPRLDPLRSDPRFQELLRRIGLAP